MCYLPRYLENEIRERANIVRGLKRRDIYTLLCKKLVENSIKKNAQIHSFRIEHPGSFPYSVPKSKRNIKKGVRNIQDAFRWGKENFNIKNFNESFVRTLAGKICPEIGYKGLVGYRPDETRLLNSYVSPPGPIELTDKEIPFFIKSLKKKFSQTKDDSVKQILAASYAHLHIARMHPFQDCNGRTARTMQNIILNYYGLPPPVIESGERDNYYNCLEVAITDWKNKEGIKNAGKATKGEGMFYSFIAGKVNASLDKILEFL